MAWRPTRFLISGLLDNTVPGKVTGWMLFAGLPSKVTVNLKGDFHRDIRGASIHFTGNGNKDDPDAESYMRGFATMQTGTAGDITAGKPPQDYVDYPYVEIYGDANGRIVLELEPSQVEVIGTPIPACESDPILREERQAQMAEYLGQIAEGLKLPRHRAICVSSDGQITSAGKDAEDKATDLMTEEIRSQLPPLGSQDGKGGQAVAYVKFFTPDSSWTWYVLEFDGEDSFFGLVQGLEKELGYFSLSELQGLRGPWGLPIERDLHWKPTTLEKIATELFSV